MPPKAPTVEALRAKMLRAARGFADYNFREYFVAHVKDDFAALAARRASGAEIANFVATRRERLQQLRRMAAINAMYAVRPVVVDHAPLNKSGSVVAAAGPKLRLVAKKRSGAARKAKQQGKAAAAAAAV